MNFLLTTLEVTDYLIVHNLSQAVVLVLDNIQVLPWNRGILFILNVLYALKWAALKWPKFCTFKGLSLFTGLEYWTGLLDWSFFLFWTRLCGFSNIWHLETSIIIFRNYRISVILNNDFMTVVVLLAFSNALANKFMIMTSQGIIWPNPRLL